MRRSALLVAFVALVLAPAMADVPVRVEQLIYSIAAFNGEDYSATFALQTADTLYLVAGADNLLSLRKTLVYWWPLTAEWKTDTDALNAPFTGTLEIAGAGGTKRIRLQRLTYFSLKTGQGVQWRLLYGAEADREVEAAQKQSSDYFDAVTAYQKKSAEYDARVEALGARISQLQARGRDASAAAAELKGLVKPVAPVTSSIYGTAPEPAQDWFVVNLAPGRYTARLLTEDGSVVEGSDKSIVAYTWRRTGGIGYEVIPGDKWTRPEDSKTPASVLYVNGSTDLYVKPFMENEVNDLTYEKTESNQASGNPSLYKWVRTADVTDASLRESVPGRAPLELSEKSFVVKQADSASLGYTIAPYDPATAAAGETASLIAFPLPIEKGATVIRFHLARGGAAVAGSDRQVRIVTQRPGFVLALLPCLAPLIVMALVLTLRARRTPRQFPLTGRQRRGMGDVRRIADIDHGSGEKRLQGQARVHAPDTEEDADLPERPQ